MLVTKMMPIALPANATGRTQRKTTLCFLRSLRRGTLAARNAAECCASNRRRPAWSGFRLAQSQYRTCQEMLILADDLKSSQRAKLQAELEHLSGALGKLSLAIHDDCATPAIGGRDAARGNFEISWRETMAAGQRLIDALKLEEEFGRLSDAETESAQSQWREARKLVELAQRDYDDALLGN